jgi:chemotaxis protein methyltransferase CheR
VTPGAAVAARPAMSPEERQLLSDVLERACGFVLREELAFIAERRLAPRLEALGLRDFGAYQRYLRLDARGAEELERAVELLVPRETYFFREPRQLEALTREVLPAVEARAASTRRLTVWSAGCASGEEAYTLAMLLGDRPALAGWSLEVLGTDLSAAALEAARRAEYGPGALRATSPQRLARGFEALGDGRHRVREPYRRLVQFTRLNLLDADALAQLPRVDVILCRNVLIYFDAPIRRRVVEHLWERLTPGGFLLLGHSENLLSLTTRFEAVPLEGDLVYRRAEP